MNPSPYPLPGKFAILDTDIGTDVDDAVALALLLACPEYVLLGCTAAYVPESLKKVRNEKSEQTDYLIHEFGEKAYPLKYRRVQMLAKLLDLAWVTETKIVNCHPGLFRDPLGTTYWNGWETWNLPCQEYKSEVFDGVTAEDFIIEQVKQHPHEVDIICIGPMTNLALAFEKNPGVMSKVKRIVFMGGHIEGLSEHNFSSDPQAVEKVFQSDAPLVMIDAETTRNAVLDSATIKKLEECGSVFGSAIIEQIHSYTKRHNRDWTYMHDPLAVYASVLSPELDFEEVQLKLLSEARTVQVASGGRKVIRLKDDLNYQKFNRFLLDRLKMLFSRLNSHSTNVFLSGSGIEGRRDVCGLVANFLFEKNANLLYCGSDIGVETARHYSELLISNKIQGPKIFEFWNNFRELSHKPDICQSQLVWDRENSLDSLRRHVIGFSDIVICLGGKTGSKKEEAMAKNMEKRLMYGKWTIVE